MRHHPSAGPKVAVVTALLAMVGLLAGCGGDDTADNSADTTVGPGGSSEATPAGDDGDILAEAADQVEFWYSGDERPLPDDAPTPDAAQQVWVISCGQIAEVCQVPADAIGEAGELLGWEMNVFDGALDPEKWNGGIRQAVAAGADAVVLVSVDCAPVRQSLIEAQTAGVKIAALHALDCDDQSTGGEAVFDTQLTYAPGVTYRETLLSLGGTKAWWLINETQGQARVIEFKQEDVLAAKYISEGFEEVLSRCETCELLETVTFTIADAGPGIQQKGQAAFVQHPDANAVMIPHDAATNLGVLAVLQQVGKQDELSVVGGEGFPGNIECVRANCGQDAGTGYGHQYEAWGTVDALIREFAGEDPVDCGCGIRLFDSGHNLPPEGQPYQPANADWREHFLRIWGVEE